MSTVAPPDRGALAIAPGGPARPAGSVVLAAIDDDAGAGPVLRYAGRQAARLGVPLRVVHVWASRRRAMAAADRLTADRIADLPPGLTAGFVQRHIVHDRDPSRALIALSRGAALLVVGGRPDGCLGETAGRLRGRTHCPLAVVPAVPVTRGQW